MRARDEEMKKRERRLTKKKMFKVMRYVIKYSKLHSFVVVLPNGVGKFIMYYDAPKVGLRCVLIQNGRVVAYASR